MVWRIGVEIHMHYRRISFCDGLKKLSPFFSLSASGHGQMNRAVRCVTGVEMNGEVRKNALVTLGLILAAFVLFAPGTVSAGGGGGGGGGGGTTGGTTGTTTSYTPTISPNGSACTGSDVTFTLTSTVGGVYYQIIGSADACPLRGTAGYILGTSGIVTCAAGAECSKAVCYYSYYDSVAPIKSGTFLIDKKAPMTSVYPASGIQCSPVDVSFTLSCADSGCGCYQKYYKVVGESDSCGTSSFTLGISGQATCPVGQVCRKKVCYYSTDIAGNVETVKSSPVFVIDKSSPLSCFSCPSGSAFNYFSSGAISNTMDFPEGGGSNSSTKIALPMGSVVTTSKLNVTGICTSKITEKDFDTIIVTDTSGSMAGTKLTAAKTADKAFVDATLLNADNKVGLVNFATSLVGSLDLTNSKPALYTAIDAYSATGYTCISCGLNKAMTMIAASSKPRYVILMSDGQWNTGSDPVPIAQSAHSTYGIVIYTIGFGSDVDATTLQSIATATDGKYYFATTANLTQIYQEIATLIAVSCPTNAAVNVGADGYPEWTHAGTFNATETVPDFTSALNAILPTCSCIGCSLSSGVCTVDLQTTSQSAGRITLNGLYVSYKFNKETNCSNGIDEDCDSLIDRNDTDCWACGNAYVDVNETCELPGTANSTYCSQSTSDCSGAKWASRGAYGSCSASCGCVSNPFVYSCVEGQCNATCDSTSDYKLAGGICYYGCNTAESCAYRSQCSTSSYCAGSIRYFNGSCASSGCAFQSEDCNSKDYYEDYVSYCAGDNVMRHRKFHDFSCSPSGCIDNATWVDEQALEDCNVQDGSTQNQCGVQNWTCGLISGAPQCVVSSVTKNDTLCQPICDGGTRKYNGTCTTSYTCQYQTENCNGYEGKYCVGDAVETRDYYCSPAACLYNTTTTETCSSDGWYNYGDVPGLTDPTCERRDYACKDSGLNDYCMFTMLENHNYNAMDGSYCTADNESVHKRDYYCDATGAAAFNITQSSECGSEFWNGGGDTPGFGNDPACSYTDYYCTEAGLNDYCTSSVTKTVDYDSLDNGDDLCDAMQLFQVDYFCNASTCDWTNPTNGCGYGKKLYNVGCNKAICGAACVSDTDCGSATCTVTYNDTCYGKKLRDYNGNSLLDVLVVTNSTAKHCLGCSCSSEQADCSMNTPTAKCVENVCGAECDNVTDYKVSGGFCFSSCSTSSCLYATNASMDNRCESNVRYYNASCSQTGIAFSSENCSARDYTDALVRYCDGDKIKEHALRHEFSCAPSGCQETTRWINEAVVEDCNMRDGSIQNQCGNQNWTCSAATLQCAVASVVRNDTLCQPSCGGDIRYYNGQCSSSYACQYQQESCSTSDGKYCVGDSIETKDYYCTPSACTFNVTSTETCASDGWYNYGDVPGTNDPVCENRNYYCKDSGLNDYCSFTATETHNYNAMDGSYCVDGIQSVESRDYYCDASGAAVYAASNRTSCGQDFWLGGGNTLGFGDDPSCVYTDYYCMDSGVQDRCTSSTSNVDYDYLDNSGSDSCLGSILIPIDYWCDFSTCKLSPLGCNYSKTLMNYGCNKPLCGAQCEKESDCPDSTCSVTYSDFCAGSKLTEYDSDKVKDSTVISSSINNTCLGGCTCTTEQAACPAPLASSYCVEGVCNAACDSASDFKVEGTTCRYGCTDSCSYSGSSSIADRCDGGVRYYGGACTATGVTFVTEDCNSKDYYGPWETLCQGGSVYRHRQFHDFSCSPSGCTESMQWSTSELIDNCASRDGAIHNQCGIEHWSCVADNSTSASCQMSSITTDATVCANRCDGSARKYGAECDANYYCTNFQSENCSSYSGSYCVGNGVETRAYSCTPSTCIYSVTSTQVCPSDGWYNYGDVPGTSDPTCENRDYSCIDSGVNDYCAFTAMESHNYNAMDGSYCMNNNRAVETRDYYCGPTGQSLYAVTSAPHDCGQEGWTGGGDTPGFGVDSSCVYADHYCTDSGIQDYCTSVNAQTWNFDYMDDALSCSGTKVGKLDYWCEASTCDPVTPTNGCRSGSKYYDLRCSRSCGGECASASDCPALMTDSICYYGSSCTDACQCNYQQERCPAPGTIDAGVCYFGVQGCDQSGCSLDTCTLQPGQTCDPAGGCLTCQDIGVILTQFSDGSSQKELSFPVGGGHNVSASIKLPRTITVTDSWVTVSGMPSYRTGERKIDAVLVTDVSASMTGEKIAQAKAADLEFVNIVLGTDGDANTIGLTSFSTKLEAFLPITNSIPTLQSHINAYKPVAMTCISCGIIKASELLNAGGNGNRVMIVMSDGVDNQAPGRVVPKAKEAWETYGIRVFAVAFGQDADNFTLQEVARVGNGKFYYADPATIVDIYREIATEVTASYASNVSANLGGDGASEWQYPGDFDNRTTGFKFTDSLNAMLSACSCPYCSVAGTDCIIGLDMSSATSGGLKLSNVSVRACSYHPSQNIRCATCSDCGGGDDCMTLGAWSEWSCNWAAACAESATCSRSRQATTYACSSPGTTGSSCSSSTAVQNETKAESRATAGLPCDDGLFCTVYDQCTAGTCSGVPRVCNSSCECKDPVCDEAADACKVVNDDTNTCGFIRSCPSSQCLGSNWTVYPQNGHDFCTAGSCNVYSCSPVSSSYSQTCAGQNDADGDGTPDSVDACLSVPGTACNGCPNPCTGCAVMSCPSSGQPTCQSSSCAATTCPSDGCGLGGCASTQMADYPTSVENACTLAGSVGTCAQNACMAACTASTQCSGNQTNQTNQTNAVKILFTEVAYDVNSGQSEWLELYNPSNASIDITGWSVSDNAKSFVIPAAVMPAGATFVIAANGSEFYMQFSVLPDVSGLSLALNDDGDMLRLYNTTSAEMDMVAWESYVSGWTVSAVKGKTIQRSPMDKDTDTNADWIGGKNPDPKPNRTTRQYTIEVQVNSTYVQRGSTLGVTGRLTNPIGTGIPSQTVSLEIRGNCTVLGSASIATGIDGTFSYMLQLTNDTKPGPYNVTVTLGSEHNATVIEVLECMDCDADGYTYQQDCNDRDASIHSGATETCNGLDDNCDGIIDSITRSCGSNVGRCKFGTQTCTAGIWGSCAGSISAIAETCNSIDDDCDGQVDDGVCSSGGGGSGGSSSSGGSYSSSGSGSGKCTPSWLCTAWASCKDGKQARACTDSNKCNVTTGKPSETNNCVSAATSNASSSTGAGGDSATICQPFELKCADSQLLNCAQDGKRWIVLKDCSNGCAGDVCADETANDTVETNATVGTNVDGVDLTGQFLLSPEQKLAAVLLFLLLAGGLTAWKLGAV